MQIAPARPDEAASLAALWSLDVLDSAPEAEFDALVQAASLACGVPISLISLMDRDRQWFKAHVGLPGATQTPRDVAFCAHTVLGEDVMEVPDAHLDARFRDNPVVLRDPQVRFYAGAPVRLSDGHCVGTLCVIDRVPHHLTEAQRAILRCLAMATAKALEGRRAVRAQQALTSSALDNLQRRQRAEGFLARTGRVAGVGGWEYELEGRRVTWSDGIREIYGVSAEFVPELEAALAPFQPEGRQALVAAMQRATEGGPGWDLELPMRRADGASRWVRAVGALDVVDGRGLRLSGALQDITQRKGLQIELEAATREVHDLYDRAPCAYYSLDAQGRFLTINAVGLHWLGLGADALIGRLGPQDFFTEAGRAQFRANYPRFLAEGQIDGLEFDLIGRSGPQRRVAVSATALRDDQGQFLRSRSVMFDISDLHRARQELARVSREQAAMLDNDVVGIVRLRDRMAVWQNRALARMFGYAQGELDGQPTRVLYPDDGAFEALGHAAYPLLSQGKPYRAQLQMRHKDGRLIWVDLSGTRVNDSESLWLLTDISEMKAYQQQVEHIAFHDPLTRLPNRLLLADRLQQALRAAERTQQRVALAYLDLDGFKQVNDAQGHDAGDRLLRDIARRLQRGLRAVDTVARLGGDEFVVILPGLSQPDEALQVLQRLAERVGEPVELGPALTARVGASIGVAFYPDDATAANTLLKLADDAMYEAKRAGRGRICRHGVADPAG